MRKLFCLLAAVAVLSACIDPGTQASTTVRADPSTSSSSTVVASTTTTLPTPTTVPEATTTVPPSPTINIFGSDLVFSTDGNVIVQGQVDGFDAEVTFDGVAVDTSSEGQRHTVDFVVELQLDPGEHLIEVVAKMQTGASASTELRVIVDPGLETQLAYLTEIDLEGGSIIADYAQWFTGEEAVDAAFEDGEISSKEEGVPGDFYIRNENPQLRTLQLADVPVIVLNACHPDEGRCVVPEAIEPAEWLMLLGDPTAGQEIVGWQWVGFPGSPFWLTLDGSKVVQITEQYIP